MTVVAPPKPPQQDLEALIEEARRRARRRRLISAATAVLALTVGGGIYGIVELTTGGSTGQAVPPGFSLVKAGGPVSHALLEIRGPTPSLSIDLATGRARNVKVTQEVWWDPKGGLERVVERVEGRTAFDSANRACTPPTGFCIPPPPFDLEKRGLHWPLDPRLIRKAERGTFRSRAVIWVRILAKVSRQTGTFERVGFDARTHQPVVYRSFGRGRLLYQQVITFKKDLPASRVSFLVLKDGVPVHSFPPVPPQSTKIEAIGLAAAQDALGTTALWFGPSFRGHRIRRVEVGTIGNETNSGRALAPVKFVRLNYGGVFSIQEFGRERPVWYLQGPEPGTVLLYSTAALSRNGLLVLISGARSRTQALSLARALEPIPG
jgi:hypothetical protein